MFKIKNIVNNMSACNGYVQRETCPLKTAKLKGEKENKQSKNKIKNVRLTRRWCHEASPS